MKSEFFSPYPGARERGKNRDHGEDVGNCGPVFLTATWVEVTQRGVLRDFRCEEDNISTYTHIVGYKRVTCNWWEHVLFGENSGTLSITYDHVKGNCNRFRPAFR